MYAKAADIYRRVKDRLLGEADPALLLFLLFLLNYRFSFKLVALLAIFILRPRVSYKMDGITLFYIAMPLLGLINLLFFSHDLSVNHVMVVLQSSLIWLLCLFSYLQIRHAVKVTPVSRLDGTLKLLVILNLIVSFADLVHVMWKTGALNPYSQISPPPYGVSSGDLIGGIFGKLHLVNTIISVLLLVYFAYRKNVIYVILALIPFLLTGSNLATLILIAVVAVMVVTARGTMRKYATLVCVPLIVLFYMKITKDNYRYMVKTINSLIKHGRDEAADTLTGIAAKNEAPTKEKLVYEYIAYKQKQHEEGSANLTPAKDSARTTIYNVIEQYEKQEKLNEQKETDYVYKRKELLLLSKQNDPFFEYGRLKSYDFEKEPGKLTSFKQTYAYLSGDWRRMLLGAGPGSFSSRTAFITSGIVDDSRLLSLIPRYETKEFIENHKSIFKYLMFLDDATHSITNLPFSWYNEVAGEYGLAGIACFIFLYMGFFVKKIRYFTYGRYLLIMMLAFFMFDYWYQRISVMIIFEMLMLIDIKIKTAKLAEAEK
jgi:hypothetical protein